nr:PQQ-binding-like beta-propeller repeat protein [Micromonospora sp. DSM 115978]
MRSRRVAVIAGLAVLALAASGAIAYRVLAPAEVLTLPARDYPAGPAAPPGVVGTLNAAPLLVDGRLRVYATTRRVWSDAPVDAATRRTPYWAYRRWPAQVVGVATSGTTVISRWSDGEVVALDAPTGRIAWRIGGQTTGQEYAGRRTGASTVYAPAGLHTARTGDGRAVLLLTDDAAARGIDPATGRELWRAADEAGCRTDPMTTTAGQFAVVDRCVIPPVVEFRDAATGQVTGRWRPPGASPDLTIEPVGCRVARSECPAFRTAPTPPGGGTPPADGTSPGDGGATRGWLAGDPTAPAAPTPAPALDSPESTLVDGVAIVVDGEQIVGRPPTGAGELWRWSEPGRVLAVQPGRVHLRLDSRDLANLDPRTGRELSRFPLTQGRDSTAWVPGLAYASNGFLAVERLTPPVEPDAPNSRYYLAAQPVILAAS